MGKGGSVSAREGTVMPQDAPVNAGAVNWPGLLAAEDAVARMQARLHLWAARDPGRRFGDLFNLVYDPAFPPRPVQPPAPPARHASPVLDQPAGTPANRINLPKLSHLT